MDNANYSTYDVKRICENKLGIDFRSAKEYNGWYFLNDTKVARITVPKGRKNVRRGTYSNMAKQLKLTNKEFDELLACPLSSQDYKKLITDRV